MLEIKSVSATMIESNVTKTNDKENDPLQRYSNSDRERSTVVFRSIG